MRNLYFIFLLFTCLLIRAQNRTIDSLNTAFKNSKDDSIKVKTLLSITDQLLQVDLKQAEATIRRAFALSLRRNSNSLLAETAGYMGYIKEAVSEVGQLHLLLWTSHSLL